MWRAFPDCGVRSNAVPRPRSRGRPMSGEFEGVGCLLFILSSPVTAISSFISLTNSLSRQSWRSHRGRKRTEATGRRDYGLWVLTILRLFDVCISSSIYQTVSISRCKS
jgi:hypothetical protein